MNVGPRLGVLEGILGIFNGSLVCHKTLVGTGWGRRLWRSADGIAFWRFDEVREN